MCVCVCVCLYQIAGRMKYKNRNFNFLSTNQNRNEKNLSYLFSFASYFVVQSSFCFQIAFVIRRFLLLCFKNIYFLIKVDPSLSIIMLDYNNNVFEEPE